MRSDGAHAALGRWTITRVDSCAIGVRLWSCGFDDEDLYAAYPTLPEQESSTLH